MFKKIYSFLIKIVDSFEYLCVGMDSIITQQLSFDNYSIYIMFFLSVGIWDMSLFLSEMNFTVLKSIILTLLFALNYIISHILLPVIIGLSLGPLLYFIINQIENPKILRIMKIIFKILKFVSVPVIVYLLMHLLSAKFLINISTIKIFIFTFFNFFYCVSLAVLLFVEIDAEIEDSIDEVIDKEKA